MTRTENPAERFDATLIARDLVAADGDLENALRYDDWLEDHGMHPDDRSTCWTCETWAAGHDHR